MKKKKLKKIKKILFTELNSPRKESVRERVDYTPYDAEISEKTKNLISKLIDHNEGVIISLSQDSFNISTPDISNIKTMPSKNKIYNDDSYLEIVVNRGEGFSIILAYQKRCNYEDKEIFNQMIDMITKRVVEINRENFTYIWDKVIKESGIIRDNNLESLFGE